MRNDGVDISKGITICLMVLGHSSIPTWLSHWIWSFHMPFFFIISALFTSWDKDSFGQFALRKAKILLLPFIIYSAINLALFPLSLHVGYGDFLKQILSTGWGGCALWFVPVFYISLLICKITKHRLLILFSLIMLILAWTLSYNKVIFPWTLSSVPFSAFLMMMTRRFKTQIKEWITKSVTTNLLLFSLTGLIASSLISIWFHLDMAWNNIIPVIPILIGIIGGISFIIGISVLMQDRFNPVSRIFLHAGRNTYEIMAISQVTIVTLNLCIGQHVIVKYASLVLILISAIYLRKLIEGKLSKTEAI